MELFAVYVYSGDTCGNVDHYGPMGYFTAPSLAAAKLLFSRSGFVGYSIEKVDLSDPKKLLKDLEKQIQAGKFY